MNIFDSNEPIDDAYVQKHLKSNPHEALRHVIEKLIPRAHYEVMITGHVAPKVLVYSDVALDVLLLDFSNDETREQSLEKARNFIKMRRLSYAACVSDAYVIEHEDGLLPSENPKRSEFRPSLRQVRPLRPGHAGL
jgi:hypothetical protein